MLPLLHPATAIAIATALALPLHADTSDTPDTKTELKASTTGESAAGPRASADGVTLELNGEKIRATARFTAPEPKPDAADPAAPTVVALEGDYHAAAAGTLRLRFGEPAPTPKSAGKLIAFWKFDEPKGDFAADLKAPDAPAKIVGGDPAAERPGGVGFGAVHALPLDTESHVATQFTHPLDATHSICMWAKTSNPGVLWAKVEPGAPGLADGSRLVHIGGDGLLEAQLNGPGGSTLRSETKFDDGAWHHFAWITSPRQHQLYIDGELEAETRPADGAQAGLGAPLRLGAAIEKPARPGLDGTIDNVRIYDFALNARQVKGFYLVGSKRAPIIITSEPQKTLRVGETFNYAIEFTGAPYVQFRFIGLPDWLKFEGRITGTPGGKDIGLSERITITGLCPWGPAQQEFNLNVLPALVSDAWQFSLRGKPHPFRRIADGIEIDLPAGEGTWSFAKKRD